MVTYIFSFCENDIACLRKGKFPQRDCLLPVVQLNNVQEKLNYMLSQKFIMLLVDTRNVAFDESRWWFVCLFVCLFD